MMQSIHTQARIVYINLEELQQVADTINIIHNQSGIIYPFEELYEVVGYYSDIPAFRATHMVI
jgi:hypothetical protein